MLIAAMESEAENKSICDLLKFTVIKFCQDNYVASGDLELDAIICLSPLGKQSQSVVKIHQILEQTDFSHHDHLGEEDITKENENEFSSQTEFNKDHQISLIEKSMGTLENSDDKWIRMNRLKVYKKKRKIVTQRRKPSVTCKLNGLGTVRNPPNSGYMLRVPSIASHIAQYTAVHDNSSIASKDLHSENDDYDIQENFSMNESKNTEMFIKGETTSPIVNESYDFSRESIEGMLNDNSDSLQESKSEECHALSCQSVFPPRQSDSYFVPPGAVNDTKDLDLSAFMNGSADSANYEKNIPQDPQVIRKRKRKQNSQSILRISDTKTHRDGDEKTETLLRSEMEPSKSTSEPGEQLGSRVPKIIIRRHKDSILAEKTIKQPRLVSLLTSTIPSVMQNTDIGKKSVKKTENAVNSSADDTKNSKGENILSDMADIVSMQKTVSSGRVMSLLKQKSSPTDTCIDRIYNCSKCGTGFKSKKSKMRHEKYTCGDLRSFECEICGKFYSRADSKTRHMFRIHGIKPGFSTQSNLSDSNFSLDDSHFESLDNEMHQNDSMEGFQNGVENDSE